ncbi:MAG: hypothetical protein WBW81_02040 [Methylocella sp.]
MSEADLNFEREKWQADIELRNKEFSLKEKELDLRYNEQRRSRWSSPLVLAVVGATLAALGNAAVTYFGGASQRKIEEAKAESLRILEMIKTTPNQAAANLRFLLETKLISNEKLRSDITAYLDQPKNDQSVALPAIFLPIGQQATQISFECNIAGAAPESVMNGISDALKPTFSTTWARMEGRHGYDGLSVGLFWKLTHQIEVRSRDIHLTTKIDVPGGAIAEGAMLGGTLQGKIETAVKTVTNQGVECKVPGLVARY